MTGLPISFRRIASASILLASLAILGLALGPQATSAQDGYFFPQGESFDEGIPSPQEFLGYSIGTFHTRQDRIVAYMQELARLSDKATYQSIGLTFEHRDMPVLTVTSPANHARLEEIRQAHLASLATDGGRADDLPAIAHLGYGVHGNEASGGEAAMLTAYWLVAGLGGEVAGYLDNAIFHLEPTLNPDGRDRFAHWANMNRAEPFVADPLDREHSEVWPGGRTNHYWFDLNRDWLPLVNPESKARIDFHHHWSPNVVTDHHEMGTSSSFFFEPTKPVGSWNPLLPEELYTDLTMTFAEYWTDAMDDIGSLFFNEETFDNSYPGYGSTYPNFLGGLAVLFEQASSRGHVQESSHHGLLTFAFTIRNQLRAGMATVKATVENRSRLQEYQKDFYASALSEGEAYEVSGWIFGDPLDATLNREFIELLLRHRIEIFELESHREGNGVSFQPGQAWVVPASQPMYRLARSIFERPETFADSVFYDASAWTVSLAYGMPDLALQNGQLPLGNQVTAVPTLGGAGQVARSSIAYLMDWSDSGAPRALQAMQAAGIRTEAAFSPFTARTAGGDVPFARGSISIPVSTQTLDPDALHSAVAQAAREANVPVHSALTGSAVEGIDLGSGNFRPVRAPRVLMPTGPGVSSQEVGQIWHLLDQRVGMPVTKVDVGNLGRVTWADYDVLILMPGATQTFSGARLDDLKSWIRSGGTLIAQRGSAAWAAGNGLTPNIDEPGMGKPVDEVDESEEAGNPRRDYADSRSFEGPRAIGGSIWEADLDVTHPLGFGYQRRFLPVWRDHNIFFEPSVDAYSTVARLTEDDPFLSGYISDKNRERLRGSPSVLTDSFGRGTVVLFIDNTNFRGYWRGTNRLFLNALFFGNQI